MSTLAQDSELQTLAWRVTLAESTATQPGTRSTFRRLDIRVEPSPRDLSSQAQETVAEVTSVSSTPVYGATPAIDSSSSASESPCFRFHDHRIQHRTPTTTPTPELIERHYYATRWLNKENDPDVGLVAQLREANDKKLRLQWAQRFHEEWLSRSPSPW